MSSSGFVGGVPVFLAKPQTYMNLSGECVCYSLRLSNVNFSLSILYVCVTELILISLAVWSSCSLL